MLATATIALVSITTNTLLIDTLSSVLRSKEQDKGSVRHSFIDFILFMGHSRKQLVRREPSEVVVYTDVHG